MKLEKFEKLAEDALTSGQFELAACLYLGLYEIAKLKSVVPSSVGMCLNCPYRTMSTGQPEPSPVTVTYSDSTGDHERSI